MISGSRARKMSETRVIASLWRAATARPLGLILGSSDAQPPAPPCPTHTGPWQALAARAQRPKRGLQPLPRPREHLCGQCNGCIPHFGLKCECLWLILRLTHGVMRHERLASRARGRGWAQRRQAESVGITFCQPEPSRSILWWDLRLERRQPVELDAKLEAMRGLPVARIASTSAKHATLKTGRSPTSWRTTLAQARRQGGAWARHALP